MTKAPNRTDLIVASRVRLRRKELRLSQETLGDAVGITFQQIQKYETGANRIGAGRLQALAEILEVPVSYFFPDEFDPKSTPSMNLLGLPGALELLRAYATVSPKVQSAIRDVALAAARDTLATADDLAEGGEQASAPA